MKKAKEKTQPVIEHSNKPKVMTEAQMRNAENHQAQITETRLLLAVEEQTLQNLNLKLALLTNDVQKQKAIIGKAHSQYSAAVNKHKELLASIAKDLGLEDSKEIKYNSLTGEIVK